MLHIYRFPGVVEASTLRKVQSVLPQVTALKTEFCFNVETLNPLSEEEMRKLKWLFTETFEPENVREGESFLKEDGIESQYLIEVGPRLAFTTAWSSNCASMCRACGISSVGRIERSRRFLLTSASALSPEDVKNFLALVHDRMTECRYLTPLLTFDNGVKPEPTRIIPILEEGKAALEAINKELGLGFDDWDLDFYTNMFKITLQRNPTDVECFDLGQSNSEHSRHWFFGGKMIIDGEEKAETLFEMVKKTLKQPSNSVIAFHDNSSAIRGYKVPTLVPQDPGVPSEMITKELLLHPILTAETHNFPSGVAPFAGAETGTGGRLRDVQATGRGAHTLAGISAYCVGNLHMPHNPLPWEPPVNPTTSIDARYPPNLARPLDICIEASNGASDYGNKYGEPVVAGFARSFGQRMPDTGERVEWIKPIMFTAGVGLLDARHSVKGQPETGMLVCKIGGPAYRIGMGGGAASSRVQTAAEAALDFDAVQRGDAEMENRMNRVLRACVELGDRNPIVSIHDQGAGGNGNVLKELVEPLGAVIALRRIPRGDLSLSAREIWGAEYQENDACLVRAEDYELLQQIAQREQCPVTAVGVVSSDGRVVVRDGWHAEGLPALTPQQLQLKEAEGEREGETEGEVVFDLPLHLVLGKMPQKTFVSDSPARAESIGDQGTTVAAQLPADISVTSALERVLRLLDVGSKRFLTNKVDRSVTGLVAQQQCVGPLHTPLSNVAVLALSHFDTKGMAVAVGEQPIKGLVSPQAQARMTVCEALSNLSFAALSSISDVKASGNWMWAAKLPHEGARMYACCTALCEMLGEMNVGIDGGKDSLSMAAKVEDEVVKAPGEVTLTVYCTCPDITRTVTPDLKHGDSETGGVLLYCDLRPAHLHASASSSTPPPPHRLAGSALATVYNHSLYPPGASNAQLNICPDLDTALDRASFLHALEALQAALQDERRLISAGHDISDGGLLVALLEMAIAGNAGVEVALETPRYAHEQRKRGHSEGGVDADSATSEEERQRDILGFLFAEEAGFLFETPSETTAAQLIALFAEHGTTLRVIGRSRPAAQGIQLTVNDEPILYNDKHTSDATPSSNNLAYFRNLWEDTSNTLEALQCPNPACAVQQIQMLRTFTHAPQLNTTYEVVDTESHLMARLRQHQQQDTANSSSVPAALSASFTTHRVAVLRQEGSNGDREMLAALHAAGLEAWDINMQDLASHKIALDERFRGVVFCGGFSYADVNDSAKGWAAALSFDASLLQQLRLFRDRADTFSLGVCNGCQLMALLGWVPFPKGVYEVEDAETHTTSQHVLAAQDQPRFIHNNSGRFESRWSHVTILPSPAVLLRSMAGSTLGIWVAHGEGRSYFPNAQTLGAVYARGLAPVRYVDDDNAVTSEYPYCPNGSPGGIAALCSEDGRHLAMMPHPERCIRRWQLPCAHPRLANTAQETAAPWLKLFQNAQRFCEEGV